MVELTVWEVLALASGPIDFWTCAAAVCWEHLEDAVHLMVPRKQRERRRAQFPVRLYLPPLGPTFRRFCHLPVNP